MYRGGNVCPLYGSIFSLNPFIPVVDILTTLFSIQLLPDDHYNLNLSSGEKVNPQRCFIYFYEAWEVEKEVVDL